MVFPQIKTPQRSTKQVGDAAENAALHYLQQAGLRLLERNYRTPGRGGGEIDLIMRTPDGTTVFVEVRQRKNDQHGGAGASIGGAKQGRTVLAARNYLMGLRERPPCRFDVVLLEGERTEWLQAAFEAY